MTNQNAVQLELVPKTRKAHNRLSELSSHLTQGKDLKHRVPWQVLDEAQHVHFSARSGPWWRIQPCVEREIAEQFSRWVHSTSDNDFDIQIKEEEDA
jgi:hypothetical protein